MWKYSYFYLNFKHYPDMISNPLYAEFSACFAEETLQSLIQSFNKQVGCRGWASARAYHNRALIDELKRRGIDVSAVSKDGCTTFAHKVKLNADGTALQIIK